MPEPLVQVEKSDGVATLTLNRPEVLNALSRALVRELADAFERLAGDPEVGVIILTGAGRAFSAGVDLKELSSGRPLSDTAAAGDTSDRLVEAVAGVPQPIIGAVNGFAVTGGFELALMCDVLIGSTRARFADTHARVGIAPGWGLSQRLSRRIGISRAKELHFSGNYIDAEQAERWGLINRVVEPEELLSHCEKLARDMLECDPRTLRTYKQVVDAGLGSTLAEGLQLESRASKDHLRGVTSQAVAERREGIQSRGRGQKGAAAED